MFHFYNLNIRFCRIKKYIFTQRKILFNVLLNETNGMFKKYCCTTTQQFVNEHFKNKDCPCNIEEYYNTPTIDDLLNEKLDFKIYEPEIQYFKLRKARICRSISWSFYNRNRKLCSFERACHPSYSNAISE